MINDRFGLAADKPVKILQEHALAIQEFHHAGRMAQALEVAFENNPVETTDRSDYGILVTIKETLSHGRLLPVQFGEVELSEGAFTASHGHGSLFNSKTASGQMR